MNRLVYAGLLSFCVLVQAAVADTTTLNVDTQKSYVAWLGKKVTGQHNGKLRLESGTIELEDGDLSGGLFQMDMGSIVNEDIEGEEWRTKLEKHLKSDEFFNVSSFPQSSFEITSVNKKADTRYDVSGNLTVKGISLPISFPVEVTKEGDRYIGKGKVTIDRSKWDIRYNSESFFDAQKLGDKLIYNDIEIELYIVANA